MYIYIYTHTCVKIYIYIYIYTQSKESCFNAGDRSPFPPPTTHEGIIAEDKFTKYN